MASPGVEETIYFLCMESSCTGHAPRCPPLRSNIHMLSHNLHPDPNC
uniref:Uncharacterized protein n=1 Tax=Anguilla anguilla TaxID=7936 RepID=A0A0E9WM96_ANGAN